MTKYIVLIGTFMFLALSNINGQIITPDASPRAIVEQKVGLTSIIIDYSRPRLKGRKIFSDIISYSTPWRLGANQATKISFNNEALINGKLIEAGEYSIICTPKKENWTFNLYKYETSDWNSYVDKKAYLSFNSVANNSNHKVESLHIFFDDISMNSAALKIQWDSYDISIPIETNENDKIIRNINEELESASLFDLFKAANYLQQTNQNLEQALVIIHKSMNPEKPTFFQKRVEALILADLGRYDEAIEAALISSNLAMKIGNLDVVRINQQAIYKWDKVR